jgi:hypothetical protein
MYSVFIRPPRQASPATPPAKEGYAVGGGWLAH